MKCVCLVNLVSVISLSTRFFHFSEQLTLVIVISLISVLLVLNCASVLFLVFLIRF
jgi:hypothetical protein